MFGAADGCDNYEMWPRLLYDVHVAILRAIAALVVEMSALSRLGLSAVTQVGRISRPSESARGRYDRIHVDVSLEGFRQCVAADGEFVERGTELLHAHATHPRHLRDRATRVATVVSIESFESKHE